jgi:hypothetical protein
MRDCLAAEPPFAWQQDYARVTETGDIEWTPANSASWPAAACVSSITKAAPTPTTALAAAALEASSLGRQRHRQRGRGHGDRYLCVQGRRDLPRSADGQGTRPARPADPPDPRSEWGDGPAIIAGSQRRHRLESRAPITPRSPSPMPCGEATLDFAPRTLWMIDARRRGHAHPAGPPPELDQPARGPQGPVVHLDQQPASLQAARKASAPTTPRTSRDSIRTSCAGADLLRVRLGHGHALSDPR